MPDTPTLLLRTFPSPIELRTPRVLLRQWKDSDLHKWIEMNADPEVRRYFSKVNSAEESRGEADRARASIAQRGWGFWAVEVPGVHSFARFLGLTCPGFEAPWQPALEIGWRLARETWHNGYATEGAAAAMKFAFENLVLPQVIAMSVTTNAPSHNVMHRLGMTRWPEMDFDHPRVPADWPLKRHIVHRITWETWQKNLEKKGAA
jgi:ribosomal-protein-alanine N-acetyltransferase